jgi:hypothetical protein
MKPIFGSLVFQYKSTQKMDQPYITAKTPKKYLYLTIPEHVNVRFDLGTGTYLTATAI